MQTDKVIIFDTTLRDGEQGAGAAFNVNEKVEIAKHLEELGVDIIEAGFPISSPGELEAVRIIAGQVRELTVCALSHASAAAIDAAYEAVKGAKKSRIHVFLSSSDIHLVHQLRKSRDEVLENARNMVAYAKRFVEDIEFSPMDSTRTDRNYLYRILQAVIEAGATTVNLPDTVGYATTREYGDLIEGILRNVPNISQAIVSAHCHDDLGLAVANSLEALSRGARQVECTINGIGERAGNAALEEIVMALKTREDIYHLNTNVDTRQIYKVSRLVSELTGFDIPANKAIVGANAFRHESGIHQDGILKTAITYEIMDPRSVGVPASELVLGKLSGRRALKERLAELGYTLGDEALSSTFRAFKELADKKREITVRDLESLVAEQLRVESESYHLEQVQVCCGDHSVPTATVKLRVPGGNIVTDAALGAGPVDAVCKAISHVVGVPNQLIEFSVKSVTEGIDAIGEVLIRIESGDRIFTGRGASTDIIVASAKAYVNALNRMLVAKQTT